VNNPQMVAGQMGTYNDGGQMVGMKPDMGGKPRKKRGKKMGEVAAVAAFKKQMKVK
jgi:hypothetical protein